MALGLRVWHISHTEVIARDSIGYMQFASQLQHGPWKEVVAGEVLHPGYPFLILAMSGPVRYFYTGPDWLAMQLSAQLAGALAGTLLVIPMYYLGRELFSRSVGLWASLCYQCMPSSGRFFADGLSESTFLLFAATGLLMGVKGLRRRSWFHFGLCGLFAGLAYLT